MAKAQVPETVGPAEPDPPIFPRQEPLPVASANDVAPPTIGTIVVYAENGGVVRPAIVIGYTGPRVNLRVFSDEYKGTYVVDCVEEGRYGETYKWSPYR